MADAFIQDDDGEWTYLGEAVVNPCQVPGCDEPSSWTFAASGREGAFEVLIGCLIEPGDRLRVCHHHAVALRDECMAREDARIVWPPRDL